MPKSPADVKALFLEDLAKEDSFLEAFNSSEKTTNNDLQTELELMIKVYNEQLESYIRTRFDTEIHRSMSKMEPNIKEHDNNIGITDKARAVRKVNIEIIRSQILELLGKNSLKD